MNRKPLLMGLIALAVLGAAGYGLYQVGMQRGMEMAAPSGTDHAQQAAPETAQQSSAQGEEATRRHIAAGLKAGDTDPTTGKKILYYHDPMVPGTKFDKPAKSPFMNMMLVPVYADSDADVSNVTVSPRTQQNLGVRTALVSEGTLSPQLSAVGSIAYNERDQAVVQARATGFVERLHVRATLDRVTKGQPLVDLYVPEWIAAQEEFLSVRRMQGTELAALVDGARQRMRLAGMNEQQIRLVESTGQTQPRITLIAPISGVLAELMVREGMTVMPGATIFRISGLSTVWAQAEVPESQSALLRPGAKVQARSPAVPGTTFDGTVQAIVPDVNSATRTLKARVELANAGGRLVPGMFVQMQFMDMRAAEISAGSYRSGDPDRQANRGDAGGRKRHVPAGRSRSRYRKRRADGDQARPAGRSAGRRLVAIPDRFGSQPEGGRSAPERGAESRCGHRGDPYGASQSRKHRPRCNHAVAWPDPIAEVGRDDDGVQAAAQRAGQGDCPR